jgi:hypothetical protein
MYDHGDLATVRIWGEGRSAACQLKVLSPSAAEPTITAPGMYEDTIAVGAADTVYWNDVEHADYYSVLVAFFVSQNGVTSTFFHFDYALDTSFVVTGAMHPDSVHSFDVVITPFTGPDPRLGTTNWTGDFLAGVLYSYGLNDYVRIVMERPFTAPPIGLSSPVVTRPEMTPAEMVASVYRKYSR